MAFSTLNLYPNIQNTLSIHNLKPTIDGIQYNLTYLENLNKIDPKPSELHKFDFKLCSKIQNTLDVH